MHIAIITMKNGKTLGFSGVSIPVLQHTIANNYVAKHYSDLPYHFAIAVLEDLESGLWSHAVNRFFFTSDTDKIVYATT